MAAEAEAAGIYYKKTIKLRFPISITFILLVIVTQNVEYGMQKSIALVL